MTSLIKRPGTLFPTLMNDLMTGDRLLDRELFDWSKDLFRPTWGFLKTMPSANITETEKDFQIELAVPGMEKKDFKVELDGDTLSISAEKKEEKEEKENGNTRKEFSYNSFCRTFTLPENSKGDKITSKYENGILRVEIPKKELTVTKSTKQIAVS